MMNLTVVYGGKNPKLKKIVSELNQIFRSNALDALISNEKEFDMSSEIDGTMVNGNELLRYINNLGRLVIRIDTYKPWWKWSRVNGYYKGGKTIFLNSRRLFRNESSIANTITHEVIHVLDTFITEVYVGHGSNSPKGKQNTTPWKVGKIVEIIYKEMGHKTLEQRQMNFLNK